MPLPQETDLGAIPKVPPQNLEAEIATLGSMLIDAEALIRGLDLLRAEDFYTPKHQAIFASMRSLHDQNTAVDIITVGDDLNKNGPDAGAVGRAELALITNQVPASLHVEHYAKIVREKAILRKMLSITRKISSDCYACKDEAQELLDSSQQQFFELSQQRSSNSMIHVGQLMQGALSDLEKMGSTSKYLTGLATGFADLDKLTSGLQPANLIIIAGRPSMGKTAFCLNIAEHVAIKEKKPVLFFSLEMSEKEMGLRLLCSQARINIRAVQSGFLERRGWPAITNVATKISEAPLSFDFATSPSIIDIRGSARRWAHEFKQKGTPLALIIIDYLQLLHLGGPTESRQQEISEISRSIKAMARELQVPIIALSQLNRRPEDKGREGRPQLSDLRESGAIEQDADMVAAIFREEVYKRDDPDLKGKAKLFVLKQRNGPIGDIDLNFLSEFTKFVDPAPEGEPF